jgi:hypothetical protein
MAAIGESLKLSQPQSSNASLTILLKAFWSVIFKPEKARRLGGVLNGQIGRQELLTRLARTFEPQLVVETGAPRGVTTQFLARTFRVPTLACEIDPVFFWEAKWRTLAQRNCRIFPEDTREFLRRLRSRMASMEERVLVYLGAHWNPQDLPLLDELRILASQLRHALIWVDDFRHPTDPGYGFDEYEQGARLDLAVLLRAPPALQTGFSPRLHSAQETGKKRGPVYLGLGRGREILEHCPDLAALDSIRTA